MKILQFMDGLKYADSVEHLQHLSAAENSIHSRGDGWSPASAAPLKCPGFLLRVGRLLTQTQNYNSYATIIKTLVVTCWSITLLLFVSHGEGLCINARGAAFQGFPPNCPWWDTSKGNTADKQQFVLLFFWSCQTTCGTQMVYDVTYFLLLTNYSFKS